MRDERLAEQTIRNFLRAYRRAPADDEANLEALWHEAKLGPFAQDLAQSAAGS